MAVNDMENKWEKRIHFLCFLIYVFTVLWFTVLKRSTTYQAAQLEPFWSYRKWFAGDAATGQEIMANIAMFIPFAFLFPSGHPSAESSQYCQKKQAATVIAAAAACSLIIEILQFVFMRGLSELDDIFSNTLGAVIGICLCRALEKRIPEKRLPAMRRIGRVVCMLCCAAVLLSGKGIVIQGADNIPKAFCFQIDGVSYDQVSHRAEISGFAFLCERRSTPFSLMLRPTGTGKKIRLETSCGLPRPDVNAYFLCDYDYTASGFCASAEIPDPSAEYEVLIRWPWSVPFSTGVFLRGGEVYYISEEKNCLPSAAGTDLEEIENEGILRICRPDYHCWVFQKGDSLYWIADRDFSFADDGKTYIEFHLWTTQIQNLPKKRLAHNNLWDNCSFFFEDYELTGNFGNYRVSCRKLPDAYAITSIGTGSYKDGRWIWKNYFRPLYSF